MKRDLRLSIFNVIVWIIMFVLILAIDSFKEAAAMISPLYVLFIVIVVILKLLTDIRYNKEIAAVVTAIDELYCWSLDSAEPKDSIQETVKVIEDYIGVRK